MPELPEVETIARTLREGGQGRDAVIGKEISSVQLLWPRTLAEPTAEIFYARLPGQEILLVGRRGKFLVFQLSLDALLVHLRMSGDIRTEPVLDPNGAPVPLQPHDRMAIEFTDGTRLAFNDTRKFGRVWLATDPQMVTGGLGPEPDDAQMTPQAFYERLHGVRRQIKPLLMDQTFLAGLGNIYTDEALHRARIHPLRPSDSLTLEEAARLWDSIHTVLAAGIRNNGASIDWAYRGGDFQNHFQVYQRTGQPCPVCGAPIERITVGQRGTHYCPNCQCLDRP